MDAERNPGGYASVRFFGTFHRQLGVSQDGLLAEPPEAGLVHAVVEVLRDFDVMPMAALLAASHIPHVSLVAFVERALLLLALEHEHCVDCATFLPDPATVVGEDWYEGYEVEDVVRGLTEILSFRTEILFDFLCALCQTYLIGPIPSIRLGIGMEDEQLLDIHSARYDLLVKRLNDVLLPYGWSIVNGFPVQLGVSSLPEQDQWEDVVARLGEAERELLQGNPADAITDAGSAVQNALALCGYRGSTLGKQFRQAGPLFDREDVPFREALEKLGSWLAAVRNQKSDAHPNPDPDPTAARLFLRISRAVIEYLSAHDVTEPGTSQRNPL